MEITKSKLRSNAASARRKKRSPDEVERRRKLMVALWYRGSQFFGSLWESQYGGVNDDTINAWQEYLFVRTEEQLATGIELLSGWGEKFPPTLGQFQKLCKARDAAPSNAPQLEHKREPKKIDEARAQAIFDMALIEAGKNPQTKEEAMRVLGMDKR